MNNLLSYTLRNINRGKDEKKMQQYTIEKYYLKANLQKLLIWESLDV